MSGSNQTVLVVKRTFLEFVDEHGGLPARKRSMSDTLLGSVGGTAKSENDEDVVSNVSTHMPADTASEEEEDATKHENLVSKSSSGQDVENLSPAVSWADESAEWPEEHSSKTTVMFRNVPNDYTRSMFMAMLDDEGFFGKFDFVYLPIDFSSKSGFGYAFINLIDPRVAESFRAHFDGFSSWTLPSHKVAEVTWSNPSQGLTTHIERYRNSPVMHEAVPDEFRPVMLESGKRVPFPPPTKAIKMPRIRQSTKRHEAFRGRRTH